MRPQRELVLLLAGHALRSRSCSVASPSETVHSAGIAWLTSRQPSVVRDQRRVAGRERASRLGQHPRAPALIDSTPPATHHVGLAERDLPRRRDGRVQARAAQPVHRRRRHRHRQPGEQAGHPRRRCGCPPPRRWRCRARSRPRAPGRGPGLARPGSATTSAARSSGRHAGQRAAVPAERRAHRVVDEDVSHQWLLRLQDPLGDGEPVVGGRHPAVDGALQDHLADLVGGSPLVRAARTCSANSSQCPSASSAVSVVTLRIRRSSPGRVQTLPHA